MVEILGLDKHFQVHLDSNARRANAESELENLNALFMKHATGQDDKGLYSTVERKLKQALVQPLVSAMGNGQLGQRFFEEVLASRLGFRLVLEPARPSERLLRSVAAVETPRRRRQHVIDMPLLDVCLGNGDTRTGLVLGTFGFLLLRIFYVFVFQTIDPAILTRASILLTRAYCRI